MHEVSNFGKFQISKMSDIRELPYSVPTCAGITFGSLVIHLTAFASPGWLRVPDIKASDSLWLGLWQACRTYAGSTSCGKITEGIKKIYYPGSMYGFCNYLINTVSSTLHYLHHLRIYCMYIRRYRKVIETYHE